MSNVVSNYILATWISYLVLSAPVAMTLPAGGITVPRLHLDPFIAMEQGDGPDLYAALAPWPERAQQLAAPSSQVAPVGTKFDTDWLRAISWLASEVGWRETQDVNQSFVERESQRSAAALDWQNAKVRAQ